MHGLKRWVYLVMGVVLTGIGIIGAFLPVLPTTIFLILAAYFFGRSSPRLEAWILQHKVFGPPVVTWQQNGAIPRRAKYMAFGGMAFGYANFVCFVRPGFWLLALVSVFFAASALYVGTRPDGPRRG